VLTAGAGREAVRRAVTDLISLARLVVAAGVPESVSARMRYCVNIPNGSQFEPTRRLASAAKPFKDRALRRLIAGAVAFQPHFETSSSSAFEARHLLLLGQRVGRELGGPAAHAVSGARSA
jgi:hypothetical protein